VPNAVPAYSTDVFRSTGQLANARVEEIITANEGARVAGPARKQASDGTAELARDGTAPVMHSKVTYAR
jgi:hypothetical protein